MTLFIIFICIIILITFILSLNIKLFIDFKNDSHNFNLCFLFFKFNIFDFSINQKKKKLNEDESELDDNDSKKTKKHKNKKIKKKKSFIENVEFIIDILKSFRGPLKRLLKKIHINIDNIDIVVASDDVAQTSILYGKIFGFINSSIAFLSNFCTINKKKVLISYDFNNDKLKYIVKIKIKLRIFVILVCVISILFNIIVNTYIRNINNKKGGD